MIRHRFGGNLRAARACVLCAVRHVPPLASSDRTDPSGRRPPERANGHRTSAEEPGRVGTEEAPTEVDRDHRSTSV